MRRKKKFLEKLDKSTGEWIQVPISEASEEMLRIYEIMDAELEIATVEEAMKLGVYVKKNKD
tara:strand:+ start:1118 stop:1303 length:186 start_codon:yes stop_codon:yes gene_type:complete